MNQEGSPKIGTVDHRKKFRAAAKEGERKFLKTVDDEVTHQDNELYRLAESINISNSFLSLYSKNYIEMTGLLYKFYFAKFLNFR